MISKTEFSEVFDATKISRSAKFPKIGIVMLLIEAILEYTVSSEKYILTLPSHHNFSLTKSELDRSIVVKSFVGGILSIIAGALADGHTGRFTLFYVLFVIGCFRPIVLLMTTARGLSQTARMIAFHIVGYLQAIRFFINPIRLPLILSEFNLPEQSDDVRKFAGLFVVAHCLGIFVSSVTSNRIERETGPLNLYCIMLLLLYVICVLAFTMMKPYLKRESIVRQVSENLFRCIFIGAYRTVKAFMRKKEMKKPNHWLDRMEIDFDQHYIYNAKAFLGLMKFFIPLLSASCAYNFLPLLMRSLIDRMAPSFVYSHLPYLGFHSVCTILCVFAFQVCTPRLVRRYSIRLSSLRIQGISHGFFALTLTMSLCVDVSIQKHATFLPDRSFGQVRFYNAHEGIAFLKSSLFGHENNSWVELPAYSTYVVGRAYVENRKNVNVRVQITSNVRRVDRIQEIVVVEKESTSCVITPRGIKQVVEFDPLVVGPPGMNDPRFPRIYILCGVPFCYGDLIFKNKASMSHVALPGSFERNKVFTVAANSYNLTIRQGELSLTLGHNIKFEAGAVYAILIHPFKTVVGGTVFTVVKPGQISQLFLLPVEISFSMASSLLFISIVEFLYTYSPPKLLSTTFSCFFVPDGLAVAIVFIDRSFWHSLVNYTMIFTYLAAEIFMTVFHVYIAYKFKGNTWTSAGVVYDEYEPNVTSNPRVFRRAMSRISAFRIK